MKHVHPNDLISYAVNVAPQDAARLETFPDWFLNSFAGIPPDQLPPQAILAVYLLRASRDEPAVPLPLLVERFRQAPVSSLVELVTAFALACALEQLKRAGAMADYQLEDPFRLDGQNSCVFPEKDATFYASNPTPEELRRFIQARLGPRAGPPSVN